MTIDTACSSSLVAIHEVAQSIARGESELAIAGGTNAMLHPETFISMCKGRFLAPDGRCKTFDASADGYARGEGAGAVILKPLAAAQADGDRIYAVIRASGGSWLEVVSPTTSPPTSS
jgi:acyl transferase domain-containing protein